MRREYLRVLLRRYIPAIIFCVSFILCLSGSAHARAWGDIGFGFYPSGSRMVAPNGLVYDPLTRLRLNLNVGVDRLYGFSYNSFYTEKPTPGVTTNSSQGGLDFTKREYDLIIGLAGRPLSNENIEFRIWSISLANLNRGVDPNKPSGFKDGLAVEGRYYLDADRLWGHLIGGYYFSKELVEADGEPYKPGLFGEADLNYCMSDAPKMFYLFFNANLIKHNGRFEGGAAWRPFQEKSPDTELRASYSHFLNFDEPSIARNTLLFEIKYYFKSL